LPRGKWLSIFGKATFDYICGQDVESLVATVEEVPDPDTRKLVEDVRYIVCV